MGGVGLMRTEGVKTFLAVRCIVLHEVLRQCISVKQYTAQITGYQLHYILVSFLASIVFAPIQHHSSLIPQKRKCSENYQSLTHFEWISICQVQELPRSAYLDHQVTRTDTMRMLQNPELGVQLNRLLSTSLFSLYKPPVFTRLSSGRLLRKTDRKKHNKNTNGDRGLGKWITERDRRRVREVCRRNPVLRYCSCEGERQLNYFFIVNT